MKKYTVIGLMSGTSLDGLDIACCEFSTHGHKWSGQILQATTVKYTPAVRKRLEDTSSHTALQLVQADTWFGAWQGLAVKQFLHKTGLKPGLVCAHGHTVFHQPDKGFTLQIGSGAALAATCGIDTVCDFRSLDIALGGQGAPLVPVGDTLLFSKYDACINLGGFANISYQLKGKRRAYDICPVNLILNALSRETGRDYDKNGILARTGKLSPALLHKLNNLAFYKTKGPKSLGREWAEMHVFPILNRSNCSTADKLHTYVEHCARLIGQEIREKHKQVLVTGGGAWNAYLMERINACSGSTITLPHPKLIDFKEALIFAFLGVLRIRNEVNTLSSVTGARHDSCGGSLWAGERGYLKNPR